MHYFLIAGEASGDLHAASLIEALKNRDSDAQFTFLGGDLMAAAARCKPIIHYRDMAYMGFVDVAKNILKIKANFKAAREAIRNQKPDCLILIDYPSFNLKMAKFAKKLHIPVYYYIPPKIWAWKGWRIKTIKKYVDKVFAIFPFEVYFYKKYDYEVDYVGNPSVVEIAQEKSRLPERKDFIKANKLQDKPFIALLPGSRVSEIKNNLPVMVAAMKQFPQYRGVIAGAPGIDPEFYSQFSSLPVVEGQTYTLLSHSRAALVTSGTATLETALMGIPQVAMYQGGGSKMVYNIMKQILKIPFVTLPNLIANKQIIPELLIHLCTPDSVAAELGKILPDRQARQSMLEGYEYMAASLGTQHAPTVTADILFHDITQRNKNTD